MKGLAGGMLSGRCFVHQCQPFAAVQTRSPAKLCHARQLHTKTVCQGTSSAATATQSPSIIYATAAGSRHDMPGHSECAARISAILSALDVSKLTSEHRPAQVQSLNKFRAATLDEVCAVHDKRYPEALHKIVQQQQKEAQFAIVESAPTYVTSSSYQDGLQAAGAAIALVDSCVAAARHRASAGQPSSGVPAGFGICRPPGHHAVRQSCMGFCLFSTVAIAARYAQQIHGLRKVMIFDYDVHHGNGTHDIFYDDPDILFVSTHQQGSYPGTGKLSEVGGPNAQHATINLPLPGDAGDNALRAAFEEIVTPAAQRFAPDIILVSAGFDAHWRDPLAGLQFRTSTFHYLAAQVKQLANVVSGGQCVFLLEGGYDLKALGDAVVDSFLGILGEASHDKFSPDLLRDEPTDKVKAILAEATRIHQL
ncbi:hypothetical protein ABBQ32_000754 [Trebouxia sp. C0010 RCD-2024]